MGHEISRLTPFLCCLLITSIVRFQFRVGFPYNLPIAFLEIEPEIRILELKRMSVPGTCIAGLRTDNFVRAR